MRGLVVTPGKAGSARVDGDLPEPPGAEGEVLVEGLLVGVCGTDREIIAGHYGQAPPRSPNRLVLGHEALGRVISDDSGRLSPGDLVTAVVRRPDPVPCASCAVGEWDMCRNGQFVECGIKQRHGFAREHWRVESDFVIPLDPTLIEVGTLMEPASVVAKAWDQVEKVGMRSFWRPRTALVTGAGPVGLLAALLGVQRGLDVHVLDRATDGIKPELVRALGATYHPESVMDTHLAPDIILECTGAAPVIVDALDLIAPGGVVVLAGMSSGGHNITFDVGQINRNIVLENNAVIGSVNANRRHWKLAATAVAAADIGWLRSLVTRRVALSDFPKALEPMVDDVKVVLDLQQ
ncbi:glucose 1-dehydrogenase [Luedemannella flava]|uniref:Glucose 1-dehydrogenase n=1 Tax=Luedemannella flava TaxID=349316 RepID=A0ABN2LJN0_9ACTN